MKTSFIKKHKFLLIAFLLLTTIGIVYIYNLYQINKQYNLDYAHREGLYLRKFPYPYKAALTICSDIDATKSAGEFVTIQSFLNSNDNTSLGQGLNLEIGNSFYCYDPYNLFSYLSGSVEDRVVIQKHIEKGFLDCMHSYGDKKDFTRDDALHALNELSKIGKKIDVWIDHSYSIDNIDGVIMGGEGDLTHSNSYHADLTVRYGFKFFWLGRISSNFVSESPLFLDSFTNGFDLQYPINSFINLSKEVLKHILGVFGNSKYSMHKDYRLVMVKTLRDGQKVYEFIRTNSHWQGVSKGENSEGLGYALSEKNLNHLIQRNGYSIIYTHLGKNPENGPFLGKETINALHRLASKSNNGDIYVTTTSRLLNYHVNRKYLQYDINVLNDSTIIEIHSIHDPLKNVEYIPEIDELQGITFYVPAPQSTHVFLNGKVVHELQINPIDESGKKSIMFPIRRLKFQNVK